MTSLDHLLLNEEVNFGRQCDVVDLGARRGDLSSTPSAATDRLCEVEQLISPPWDTLGQGHSLTMCLYSALHNGALIPVVAANAPVI